MAARSDNSAKTNLTGLLHRTGEGIVIDIGTGDGRFVSAQAKKNPAKFYIGIDPNVKPLEKISMKATRKPSKGGLPNVLFIQASVEDLPEELAAVADEIHIHFPWGSLLRAVATGERPVLDGLSRICAPGCLVEIVIGTDPTRDRSEIERLGLPPLSIDYIQNTLLPAYAAAGFEIVEKGILGPAEWPRLETSWAKKLRGSHNREIVYLVLRWA